MEKRSQRDERVLSTSVSRDASGKELLQQYEDRTDVNGILQKMRFRECLQQNSTSHGDREKVQYAGPPCPAHSVHL